MLDIMAFLLAIAMVLFCFYLGRYVGKREYAITPEPVQMQTPLEIEGNNLKQP